MQWTEQSCYEKGKVDVEVNQNGRVEVRVLSVSCSLFSCLTRYPFAFPASGLDSLSFRKPSGILPPREDLFESCLVHMMLATLFSVPFLFSLTLPEANISAYLLEM